MHNRHDRMASAPQNRHNHNRSHAENPHTHTRDLSRGPVDFRLGTRGDEGGKMLEIIDPMRDLSSEELAEWRQNIDLSHKYFVTDPSVRDASDLRGIKALRDGESIVFGRENTQNGRFDFDELVSRAHVRVTREGDMVHIDDLNSLNGTHVGRGTLRSLGIRQPRHPQEHVMQQPIRRREHAYQVPERLMMRAQAASLTHEGHPDRNDDSYFINEATQSAGVFDGVGGHKGSDDASRIAAETAGSELRRNLGPVNAAQAAVYMDGVLRDAHRNIVQNGKKNEDGENQPATTATIVKTFEDERGRQFAMVASVGDSRAYLVRNGQLRMLTTDQSMAIAVERTEEDKLAKQWKFANVTSMNQLTPDEQAQYKQQNIILNALGSDESLGTVQKSWPVYLQPGDRLLLTSDGIHDNLTTDEIQEMMRQGAKASDLTRRAQMRSRLGNERYMRAKQDDMTAVVLDFDK